MSVVEVVAHVFAKQGKESDVRTILESFVEPTRREKGCIKYDLFIDSKDTTKFTFVETWASLDDLKMHNQSQHLADGGKKLKDGDLLAQPTTVHVLNKLL